MSLRLPLWSAMWVRKFTVGYPYFRRGTHISRKYGYGGTYICGNTGMGAPIFPEIWVRGVLIFRGTHISVTPYINGTLT